MNERIKELLFEAGYNIETDGFTKEMSSGEMFNKFAELLVQECASICEDHPTWTARMVGNQIKDNFGVE